MKTVSPVIKGLEAFEIVFGANQPEYNPLPALVGSLPTVAVISRWVPTDEERLAIALGADIYTVQNTFGSLFQPLNVCVSTVDQDAAAVIESFGIGEILPKENVEKTLDTLLG
jgi:hypothetical protein